MPDNLQITTPISGNESIGRTQPSRQGQPAAPVDPARVAAPGTEKQPEQSGDFEFLLNRSSVFSTFVEQLNQMPGLSDTMLKVLFDLFSKTNDPQAATDVSAAMRRLAQDLPMDRADMLDALQFQMKNQTKFSGTAFDALREIATRSPGGEFETRLAEFLKAYDGYFSVGDTTAAIAKELGRIARQIPAPHSTELTALAAGLKTDQALGSLPANLILLKEKVIPMLSRYVHTTNDFGPARDTVTLLLHDIARLNASSQGDLREKLASLLDYCRYELNFPPARMESLKALFQAQMTAQGQKPENPFFESLLTFLSDGARESGSGVSQSLFRDTANALLLDQSVYMPFVHVMLPAAYNGKFLFSELWVEKVGEQNGTGKTRQKDRPVHVYLKFEIKTLGAFAAEIVLAGRAAKVRLSCPAALEKNSAQIGSRISSIFTANGLTPESVELLPENSIAVEQQLMKKIYERKRGIDVSV